MGFLPITTTFSYGQRSKCADLLNSYLPHDYLAKVFTVFPHSKVYMAQLSRNQLHHYHLRSVTEADIDGMCPQAAADDHLPAIPLKITGAERKKKLILGRHHAAQPRKAYRPAVKMTRERKVRPPCRIGIKKQGRMRKQNLEPVRAGRADTLP